MGFWQLDLPFLYLHAETICLDANGQVCNSQGNEATGASGNVLIWEDVGLTFSDIFSQEDKFKHLAQGCGPGDITSYIHNHLTFLKLYFSKSNKVMAF